MSTLPPDYQLAVDTIAQYLSTADTPGTLRLTVNFVSDQNNTYLPLETLVEAPEPTGSSGSEAGGPVLEAIPDLGAGVQPEVPSASSGEPQHRRWTVVRLEVPSASALAGHQGSPADIDEGPNCQTSVASDYLEDGDSYAMVYRSIWGGTLPKVTLSAFTETGQAESSIKVQKQRSYTGRRPAIPSLLADMPCTTLGIQGILDQLNATLATSHTLARPSLLSLLEDCIEKKYDFGMAYARLRPVWHTKDDRTMEGELRKRENEDMERRRKALVGNRIVDPFLPYRRVWDLFSNRVIPYWIGTSGNGPYPISHAWVDDKDREDVWTPINGKEWPVPIPKGVDLRLVRIELMNLKVEYAWLDVLCLRQRGGPRDDLRVEEWKQDVPTIGRAYIASSIPVVIYLSGLGRPLSLKEGDLDSDRCWFRRAWTAQEVGFQRIIAGDTPDGPMHAKEIDDDGNYEIALLTRFHTQRKSMGRNNDDIFAALADMQKRVSTNPVDKVAGLTFRLGSTSIPLYYESASLEDAWTALVDAMGPGMRGYFLFVYPEVGLGCKRWRPSWNQVMTQSLPADVNCHGYVKHVDETDEDLFEGPCIEKGLVRGLDAGSAEGVDRCGELVVDAPDGSTHTFKICANHKYPIPEDTYTLLGSAPVDFRGVPVPQYWVVGQRLLGEKFEKVSVFYMDHEQAERLRHLSLAPDSRSSDDKEFSETHKECETAKPTVHAASVANNLLWPANIRAEAAAILL